MHASTRQSAAKCAKAVEMAEDSPAQNALTHTASHALIMMDNVDKSDAAYETGTRHDQGSTASAWCASHLEEKYRDLSTQESLGPCFQFLGHNSSI